MSETANLQWWWGDHDDSEIFQGPFSSRDEAIAAAQADRYSGEDEPSFVIFTARLRVPRDDFFTASDVMEQFEEHNEDCWGEDGPNAQAVSNDALLELQQALTGAFAAWRAKHSPWRPFMLDSDSVANGETVLRRPTA